MPAATGVPARTIGPVEGTQDVERRRLLVRPSALDTEVPAYRPAEGEPAVAAGRDSSGPGGSVNPRPREIRGDAIETAPTAFRQMFFDSPVAMGLADERGSFIAVNPALCRLFGRPDHEVLGSSSIPFTHPDDLAGHSSAGSLIRSSPHEAPQIQKRFVRPSGEVRWVWMSISHTRGPIGQEWTIAHMQDVTDLKAADLLLRDSEQRLRTVIDVVRSLPSAGDFRNEMVHAAMRMIDADGAVLLERSDQSASLVVTAATVPRAVGATLPWDPGSDLGRAWASGEVRTLDSAAIAADPQLGDRLQEIALEALDVVPVRLETDVVALLVVGSRTAPGPGGLDPHGMMPLLAGQTAMAVHQATLLRRLELLATTDELSGLANRRSWTERLPMLMSSARNTARILVVGLADLDHFKAYNDAHGHLAGDELIRRFARAAGSTLAADQDAGSVLSRWGGEEFALARVVDRIEDVEPALLVLGDAVPDGETCSVGYAIWDGSESVEQLMERVDRGLYEAKLAGRNRITFAG